MTIPTWIRCVIPEEMAVYLEGALEGSLFFIHPALLRKDLETFHEKVRERELDFSEVGLAENKEAVKTCLNQSNIPPKRKANKNSSTSSSSTTPSSADSSMTLDLTLYTYLQEQRTSSSSKSSPPK